MAGRRVTQLRFESRGLARTRTRLIADLGAATYDCEENRAAELLTDLRALDGRREACDAEIRATLEAARARSAEERLAVGATEIRRPDET